MSDLERGSTVGGSPIVTVDSIGAHTHTVDDIFGIVPMDTVGTIKSGPFKFAPPGWLFMHGGGLLNRANYPELWNYIAQYFHSTSDANYLNGQRGLFSEGNGTTTFRLPNMDGLFVRGYGGNSHNSVGHVQGDAMQNIEGQFTVARGYNDNSNSNYIINSATGAFETSAVSSTLSKIDNAFGSRGGQRIKFDASKSVRTANENRPVNVAWRYIIKY